MKQIYHHFSKWEDYKNGFYNSSCNELNQHINKSIELLSNQDEFYKIAKLLVNNWTFCIEHNLTDSSINKIAYIGQASCCFKNKTPSFVTKQAWGYIDEDTRIKANATAKKVLKEWELSHELKGSLWA